VGHDPEENQQRWWSDSEQRSGADSVSQSLSGSSQSSCTGQENLEPPADGIQFPTGRFACQFLSNPLIFFINIRHLTYYGKRKIIFLDFIGENQASGSYLTLTLFVFYTFFHFHSVRWFFL
jgi:hypothetical protein